MAWLERASKLGNKASIIYVALAIWHRRGIVGEHRPIKVTNNLVAKFGVSRRSKYAALKALEEAGLLLVHRVNKKAASVMIVEVVDNTTRMHNEENPD